MKRLDFSEFPRERIRYGSRSFDGKHTCCQCKMSTGPDPQNTILEIIQNSKYIFFFFVHARCRSHLLTDFTQIQNKSLLKAQLETGRVSHSIQIPLIPDLGRLSTQFACCDPKRTFKWIWIGIPRRLYFYDDYIFGIYMYSLNVGW